MKNVFRKKELPHSTAITSSDFQFLFFYLKFIWTRSRSLSRRSCKLMNNSLSLGINREIMHRRLSWGGEQANGSHSIKYTFDKLDHTASRLMNSNRQKNPRTFGDNNLCLRKWKKVFWWFYEILGIKFLIENLTTRGEFVMSWKVVNGRDWRVPKPGWIWGQYSGPSSSHLPDRRRHLPPL